MKIQLCFGLPGTGKSTYVENFDFKMHLDLGHNAFRNEEQREKFYRKAKKHTTSELCVFRWLEPTDNIKGTAQDIIFYDTYPEYFDLSEVRKCDFVTAVFAIPTVEELTNVIIPRVGERDGKGEFYKLYCKMGLKWRLDWLSIMNKWKSALGKSKVYHIHRYDDLCFDYLAMESKIKSKFD